VHAVTLIRSSAEGTVLDILKRSIVLTTERTFERLLGYRAFLRAYVDRTGDGQRGQRGQRLKLIEIVIALSRTCHSGALETGYLWIKPVHDNFLDAGAQSAPTGWGTADRNDEVTLAHLLARCLNAPLLTYGDDRSAAESIGVKTVEHPDNLLGFFT